jgi:diguanylate cyclase (GGDEF)-like protein
MGGVRSALALCLAVLAGAFACADGATAEPPSVRVIEAGDGERIDLGAALTVLDDPDSALDPGAALQAVAGGRFRPIGASGIGLRLGAATRWFHLTLANRDHPSARWLLAPATPRSERIEVWWRSATDEGRYSATPGAAALELALPAGATQQLLLRVTGVGARPPSLPLMTAAEFARSRERERLRFGLVAGILLGFIALGLALAHARDDALGLWYGAASALVLLDYAARDPIGQQLTSSIATGLAAALHPLAVLLALALLAELARWALALEPRWRNASRALQVTIGLLLAAALLSLTPLRGNVLPLVPLLGLGFAIVLLIAAAVALRRAERAALPWLLAALLLGALSAWDALADGAATILAASLGLEAALLLAALLLVAAALAQRQREARSAALVDAARAREVLEKRVLERTRELERAAAQLEELNQLLRDMSLRDSLTGLYNRRCIDQVLVEAWKTTATQKGELSLLMLDIDHFKSINDRFGHAVGDDCLREVAQRIARHATTLGAIVGRYGGEEFIVVLPGSGADIAAALGEALRGAVAGAPVKTQSVPLAISVSVGTASAPARAAAGLGELIKRADQALYEAKRGGRNRVVAR